MEVEMLVEVECNLFCCGRKFHFESNWRFLKRWIGYIRYDGSRTEVRVVQSVLSFFANLGSSCQGRRCVGDSTLWSRRRW